MKIIFYFIIFRNVYTLYSILLYILFVYTLYSKYYSRGREGVLGDEGVLVDGNITTTVIDLKIFYINELCIMLMLPNILRIIEDKLNILNNIIDYIKSAFSAILL